VRFLCDMGVSVKVVEWLRSQGHKGSHLREQGLQRLEDVAIFAKAIAEESVVVTFDLDFGEIAAMSGGRIASVIVFRLRNTRVDHVIERLREALSRTAAALEKGAIVVEEGRVRVRELPIGGAE
jgi:predicted nuclease of predicted toxin-antitoxin system